MNNQDRAIAFSNYMKRFRNTTKCLNAIDIVQNYFANTTKLDVEQLVTVLKNDFKMYALRYEGATEIEALDDEEFYEEFDRYSAMISSFLNELKKDDCYGFAEYFAIQIFPSTFIISSNLNEERASNIAMFKTNGKYVPFVDQTENAILLTKALLNLHSHKCIFQQVYSKIDRFYLLSEYADFAPLGKLDIYSVTMSKISAYEKESIDSLCADIARLSRGKWSRPDYVEMSSFCRNNSELLLKLSNLVDSM